MTASQLEKLVAAWQHRLRLDDWDIEVVAIAAASVDYQRNKFGLCYTETRRKAAKFVIAMDADDPEATVVHELLHIIFDENSYTHRQATEQLGADGRAISDADYERAEDIAIESLTRTLLELHRRKN